MKPSKPRRSRRLVPRIHRAGSPTLAHGDGHLPRARTDRISWVRMHLRAPTGSRIFICSSRICPDPSRRSRSRHPAASSGRPQPDPTGAALAEYFASSTAGQGDLYLSPEVKSDLPPPGGSLPLGGSTGSLIQLANGVLADGDDPLSGPGHRRCRERTRRQPGLRHRSDAGDARPGRMSSAPSRSPTTGRTAPASLMNRGSCIWS